MPLKPTVHHTLSSSRCPTRSPPPRPLLFCPSWIIRCIWSGSGFRSVQSGNPPGPKPWTALRGTTSYGSARVAAASRGMGRIADPWARAVSEIWGAEHVADGKGVHVPPREGSDGGSSHSGSPPGMIDDSQKLVAYEPATFPAQPPAYPEPPESSRASQSPLESGFFYRATGEAWRNLD